MIEKEESTLKISLDKIAILIPAKDRAQVLPQCLSAIYSIDYPKERISLLFLDDRSLDKTGEIFKEFKSNYEKEYNSIEILRLEGNPKERNIARARNILIQEWKKIHTDWALFVDSDVIVPKDVLKILLQKARDERADIVCMPYAENPRDLHKPFEEKNVNIHLGCTLFSKRALNCIGSINLRFKVWDDVFVWFKAIKLGLNNVWTVKNRCLHLKKTNHKRYTLRGLLLQPHLHVLLAKAGILQRAIIMRYLFYYSLLTSLALSFIYPYYFIPLFLLIFIVGLIHHRINFFRSALPNGIFLCIGLPLQFFIPERYWTSSD